MLTVADALVPILTGGFQGFIRGSAAHSAVLAPTVRCSLLPTCMAASPSQDQSAFTLAIRAHNFSCQPRELFCASSVKKLSYTPLTSSSPILVASRRHRLPKPYRPFVSRIDGCVAHPDSNPWRSFGSPHAESKGSPSSDVATWAKHLAYVYLQPVGDFFMAALSCLAVHGLAQVLGGLEGEILVYTVYILAILVMLNYSLYKQITQDKSCLDIVWRS